MSQNRFSKTSNELTDLFEVLTIKTHYIKAEINRGSDFCVNSCICRLY